MSAVRRTLVGLCVSIGLTVMLAEVGAAALIYSGRIPARTPTYAVPERKQPFFVDIDPHFGAWHPPHRTHPHRRACFSTRYETNSYGAIDQERSKDASIARVIVLGDSFATGHGVIKTDRFSNRLETQTGVPHLNFAAGGTGPTQYLKVYEHLARDFDHDAVLVSILPANDFFDDQPTPSRFRPYWDGEYPNYTLRYTLDKPSDSPHHPSQVSEQITAHDVLGSFSFFYNVADWVAGYRKIVASRKAKADYSGYYDFTEAQAQRLRYSLERLKALVDEGPIDTEVPRLNYSLAVMLIPRYLDLLRYQREGHSPLGDLMTKTASTVGFTLIDLLPAMAKQYAGRERELFLGCDGHWSPLGHEVAATTLQSQLYGSGP